MNLFGKRIKKSKGSSGPTAIFVTNKRISPKNKVKNEQKEKEFLDYAVTKITANRHTIKELECHLITHYGAKPYMMSESEMKTLKINVIINHFRDCLDCLHPLPPNASKQQLLAYIQADTSVEQASDYPADKLGLEMKAYTILLGKDKQAMIQLEITTEHIIIKNAQPNEMNHIMNDILLWRGVSQEDIDTKSKRFIVYAHMLRKNGELVY